MQSIDNETIDKSFIKGDFVKTNHQEATKLNDFDQNIEIIFAEKNTYHQIGNAYLQYEMTKEKDVANAADKILVDGDVIRLVKKAFAFCLEEARLSTTGGSDIEHEIM